ncbi:MAG: deaminase [Candidatus Woesearchaeota archaeon]
MFIIGVVGQNGSGKTTFTNVFESRGYKKISLSDYIRAELKKEGEEISRDNLLKKGNELRKKYGPEYLAKKAIDEIKENNYQKVVIESIRNPHEFEELNKLDNFKLIRIVSDPKKRYKRLLDRDRDNEINSFSDFLELEERENSKDENFQKVEAVEEKTPVVVRNDDTLEKFKKKISLLIDTIERPKWDRYFMNIAELVSERSTCYRRHVGAVIVKEKEIITTGYNGPPKKTKHCLEVGCFKERNDVSSGKGHDDCRAAHAEQNAITQASFNGVSTKGAKIYITSAPCSHCSKLIINSGIKEVIYKEPYPDSMRDEMFKQAGITVRKL